MKILVLDTETNGLLSVKYIGPDTLDNCPYIVQLSYLIYDDTVNEILEIKDNIIKLPKNIIIPDEIAKIHGISNKISDVFGYKLTDVLSNLFNCLKNIDKIVGHNILFDINMLKVELLRNIYDKNMTQEQTELYKSYLYDINNFTNITCTMKQNINFCNIQVLNKFGKPYLKYPTLCELHEKMFNNKPKNLHDSSIDILVTLRCFVKSMYNIDLIDTNKLFRIYTRKIY